MFSNKQWLRPFLSLKLYFFAQDFSRNFVHELMGKDQCRRLQEEETGVLLTTGFVSNYHYSMTLRRMNRIPIEGVGAFGQSFDMNITVP